VFAFRGRAGDPQPIWAPAMPSASELTQIKAGVGPKH